MEKSSHTRTRVETNNGFGGTYAECLKMRRVSAIISRSTKKKKKLKHISNESCSTLCRRYCIHYDFTVDVMAGIRLGLESELRAAAVRTIIIDAGA